MSLRHRFAKPFGRKLSGPVDRGWGDTIVGPLEAPREGEPDAQAGADAAGLDGNDEAALPNEKRTGHF